MRAHGYNLDHQTCTLSEFYGLRSLMDSVMFLLLLWSEEDDPWCKATSKVLDWVFTFFEERFDQCADALNAEDCDEARFDCDVRP